MLWVGEESEEYSGKNGGWHVALNDVRLHK